MMCLTDARTAFGSFSGREPENIKKISGGHVNRSFIAECGEARIILQRLDRELFGSRLAAMEKDYLLYAEACERLKDKTGDWEFPQWIRSLDDSFFQEDKNGGIWRAYHFIVGDTVPAGCGEDILRSCGEGLAKLHYILSEAGDGAEDILPGLHDLEAHIRAYRAAVKETSAERLSQLEDIIEEHGERLCALTFPGRQLIHGDVKAANLLMRDGRVIAAIDTDSFMNGPRILDIADCMRSMCMNEDGADEERCSILMDAYTSAGFVSLSKEERDAVPQALSRICFELGLRYYTDHLRGNIYFSQDHPGQNLRKAERLLRFSARSEDRWIKR